MTDTPAEISNQTADQPEDWQEGPDLPIAQVREVFGVLLKALRSFQLYDEQNPVRKRFLTNLREAFQKLWQEVEGINLTVEEGAILSAGEQIYQNPSRSDSLAFLLYKDGIRDVTILSGVEGPELGGVLDTNELAVVSKTHAETQHLHQPMVKVIADQKGAPLATPITVDLSQSERTIVQTTDAQKYGIRVADYLI